MNRFAMMAVFMAAFSFFNSISYAADISVDEVQKYFLADEKPIKTMTVYNQNETTKFFVEAQISERQYDEEEDKWVKVPDESKSLMVSPSRFIMEPKSSRRIRLVYNKPMDGKEHMYSVAFLPSEYKDKAPWEDASAEGVAMGTKFVVTTGMLVTVSPAAPKSLLTFERDVSGITFTNEGNTQVDLRMIRSYCYGEEGEKEQEDENKKCIELPSKRVYPGHSWRFDVDGSIPIEWPYRVYNRMSSERLHIEPTY